ncbi:protein RRP6-like 2 isoform X2 [Malania oleifera]|uniref:protein RRP6-like 2 isoform X2 n=1 Tax=Malania oleifera TaxID=397392 RepID=UPI0025ADE01D|nr:protein RRP6-like 2 isoform X2 [Malania oleifera]XP_057983112.1 protein RRP6-like 2 isoform X2 [Malania oleifera]
MEVDPADVESLKQRAEALHRLSTGSLSSSISKLSHSLRHIPAKKDFHFFYNFEEFKTPVKEIADKSQFLLESVGTSTHVLGKSLVYPDELDDAYDWLVNVNDEVFERFDVSVDEFQGARKNEVEAVGLPLASDGGFQLVGGKKKKGFAERENVVSVDVSAGSSATEVKVASRDKVGAKPRVPFHIPTIPRPQDVFNILVNNSNEPFQHVWLQKSDDGTRFVHPLEKISIFDFIDRNIKSIEPAKPPPIESTPFKLVEEIKDLKALAAKLGAVNEFAVDLEHNQYRSFQGLTCLMQISTRSEDFVVDTLKLRIHVGPYLRDVFKDPAKRKVMHGADRDIMWLQRDFGIYVCNLFDTGQASRVLKLERNSLEFLLHHFCGVTADKEYQNADWRLRPLPVEMLRYAREDTHYLLHIYDLMRIRLLSTSTESENYDALLVQVYERSYDVCMQLYKKELLTDSSYLHIYGLQGTSFNPQQLAVVAGLSEWRDVVARAEDESTGYILPNKMLLDIAKKMPVTTSKLRWLVKSKHPYVERNLGSVVSIIRHSIQNASAFEAAAEHLKGGQIETASEANMVDSDGSEPLPLGASTVLKTMNVGASIDGANAINGTTCAQGLASVQLQKETLKLEGSVANSDGGGQEVSSEHGQTEKIKTDMIGIPGHAHPMGSLTIPGQNRATNTEMSKSPAEKVVAGATVQLLKKPTCAFGAMLGNVAPKKKSNLVRNEKEQIKLEQIKSAMNLQFFPFSGRAEQLKPLVGSTEGCETRRFEMHNPEERILLDGCSDVDKPGHGDSYDTKQDYEPTSLSDLSSSFQKCFQPINKTRKCKQVEKSQESHGLPQIKPFDYEAVKKHGKFEQTGEESGAVSDRHMAQLDLDAKKNLGVDLIQRGVEGSEDFPLGVRRQAFPASGNRSATFC